MWVDFPLRRAFPHVDKPESETRPSSPVEQAGYRTRVFEAVVDASGHRGLGFFSSLGLSFRFPEGDGLRGGARLLSMVALEAEPILCGVPSPLTYSVGTGLDMVHYTTWLD